MLIQTYLKLNIKIQRTRQNTQDKHPSRLGVLKLAKLFLLELTLLIIKYLLLLLKHPAESFKIFVNQPPSSVYSYSYSYTDHRQVPHILVHNKAYGHKRIAWALNIKGTVFQTLPYYK